MACWPPFRCPACEGCGQVPSGFYNRFGVATTTIGESCRACVGSGLIYSWDHDGPPTEPFGTSVSPPKGWAAGLADFDEAVTVLTDELADEHPFDPYIGTYEEYGKVAKSVLDVLAPLIAKAVEEAEQYGRQQEALNRALKGTNERLAVRVEDAEADAERLAEALHRIGERSDLYVPIVNHNWTTALHWGQDALAAHEARKATA